MQDYNAANGEADDRAEGRDLRQIGAEAETFGKNSGEGARQAQSIEPHRSVDWIADIRAQTELQQQSSQPNGRDDDDGQRALECAAAGVENHQGECEKQQGSRKDGPAARPVRGRRVGSGVGQGVPVQSYTGRMEVFKVDAEVRQWAAGWVTCRPAILPGEGLRCSQRRAPVPLG